MSKLSLYYPAEPYQLNQAWGIYNPAYQQFGFSRHNGIDIALGADKKLYAPCDGTIVRHGNQPNGGGIFLGMMTGEYDWDDGKYRVLLDFLHCETLIALEGATVKAGDLLAVADNTGFSTGPHTHIQPRRVKNWNNQSGPTLSFELVDQNDANGSFDPRPYFNGYYATDANNVIGIMQRLVGLLQKAVSG